MNPIVIHDFTPEHLPAAGRIALQLWGGEVPTIPERLRPDLYQYLTRYYYDRESPYCFGASCAGELCGLLLGCVHHPQKPRDSEAADAWISERLIDDSERETFRAYKAYLEHNRTYEQEHARDGEVLLLLFASIRKGCGKELMRTFMERCRADGRRSMLLWTDETCDFEYYEKNGFVETARIQRPENTDGLSFTTYLFRKAF